MQMKMMAGEISNSPAAGRKSSMMGKSSMMDLKAAAGLVQEGKDKRKKSKKCCFSLLVAEKGPKEASPAKAAKLNMLKKVIFVSFFSPRFF